MCNTKLTIQLPDFIKKELQQINKIITIDACMTDALYALWGKKIITLSHCCGHNKIKPSIVIDQSYKKEDINKIKELIKKSDSRYIDVMQWRLIRV